MPYAVFKKIEKPEAEPEWKPVSRGFAHRSAAESRRHVIEREDPAVVGLLLVREWRADETEPGPKHAGKYYRGR